MPDDPSKRGRADRDRINVHERHELRYWTDKFGCSDDELRGAVQAVGPMVRDVEAYLEKHRRKSA